jgi:2-dehydropantoate 2-reductase
MRICVVGAGAIGGLLAVRLAAAGHQVSVIVRGTNLQAVRARGMKLLIDGCEQVAQVAATDRLEEAGPQDVVILALKAHQVAMVAPQLRALMQPHTVLVTAQNGVPWWYFHGLPGPYEGRRLESVDPGGFIAQHVDAASIVGSIVYPAAELVEPGVIQHQEGNRFSIGEPDGSDSERVRQLSQLLREAGFKAPVSRDIRSEIWLKLWGNCTFNPISALSHATLVDICEYPPTRALAADMMREAQAIAEKLGVRFAVSLEKRIAGAAAVGKHKTSMLQDVELGRPIELQALLGSVIELAAITETPAPTLTAIHAVTSLLAATLQQQHGRLRIEPAR